MIHSLYLQPSYFYLFTPLFIYILHHSRAQTISLYLRLSISFFLSNTHFKRQSKKDEFAILRRRLQDLYTLFQTDPVTVFKFLEDVAFDIPSQVDIISVYEEELESFIGKEV